MEELLQLNDEERIEYRLTTISAVNTLQLSIVEHNEQEKKLRKKYEAGAVTPEDFEEALAEIEEERDRLRAYVARANGTKELPPLQKVRMGVQLHP